MAHPLEDFGLAEQPFLLSLHALGLHVAGEEPPLGDYLDGILLARLAVHAALHHGTGAVAQRLVDLVDAQGIVRGGRRHAYGHEAPVVLAGSHRSVRDSHLARRSWPRCRRR